MSKTIDERVVEMRFDNKQFESNVATSMSTLEKLKKSLKFDGASKGLEDIGSAAGKVNMSGLSGAVESVTAKFSAMDVIAITALTNITNKAINAGEQLVKSLSIDQITAGWDKFSEKTTSVATLVAQGNAIEDVNAQLDRLNWFTDETSYNFTDMVSNIAKFTATGKGLEESVTAMEGIANWAALSGQNATTASRAMYQLSQAMGSGVMRKEDYKSIQNASMDTEEFRQKCIDAGIALGTLKDNGDGTFTSLKANVKDGAFTISQFADHLTEDAWLTSDVMMEVFNEYSSAVNAIYEVTEEKGMLASEVLDEVHDKAAEINDGTMSDTEAINAAIKELGYTASDGSLLFDAFGIKAFEAAQKARTFKDAIDSVKDAVSTGWMNTFELLFGDANQATELWTNVANQLWDIFAGGGETRNNILENTMVSGWDKLIERINDAGIETSDYEQALRACAEAGGENISELIKEHGSLADVFKNGALSTDYLTKALDQLSGTGNEVKETLDGIASIDFSDILTGKYGETAIAYGSDAVESVKKIQTALLDLGYTMEDYGADGKFGPKTWQAVAAFQKEMGLSITGMVDKETLAALEEAHKSVESIGTAASEATGGVGDLSVDIDDLVDSIARPSGQELLFSTISNSLTAIATLVGTVREAWGEIFTDERTSSAIYNMLSAMQRATESLVNSIEKNTDKLKSTFKGLIAIFDILTSIVGGALKAAFEVLGEILGTTGGSILDITANIGDVIVAFRDWLFENELITKGFNKIVKAAKAVINTIKKWIAAFSNIPSVRKVLDGISNIFGEISDSADDMDGSIKKVEAWFKAFYESPTVQAMLEQLHQAFLWIAEAVEDGIAAIGEWFAAFEQTEGVHELITAVNDLISAFGKLFSGEIDSTTFARTLGTSLANALLSLPKIARQVASDFIAGFQNGIVDGVGGIIGSIVEFCLNFVSSFAEALGVESPSWKAYEIVCDFFQGAINAISDMLGPVLAALEPVGEAIVKIFKSFWDYITDEDGGIKWDKIIAGAITIETILILKSFTEALDKFATAATSFKDVLSSVTGVFNATKTAITNLGKAASNDLNANALLKVAGAIGILAASIWVLCQIDDYGKLWNAVGMIVVLAGVIAGLAWAMNKLGSASIKFDAANKNLNIDGLKTTILQLGIALLAMAVVVKLIGSMTADEAKQGLSALAGMAVGMIAFMAALGGISKYSGEISGISGMIMKLSVAMILMVAVCKLAGKLSAEEMLKGAAFAAAFAIFANSITKVAKTSGNNVGKVGTMLIGISVAMILMVAVCKLAAQLSAGEMLKGAAFAAAFVLFVKGLVSVTKIGKKQQLAKVNGLVLSVSVSLLLMAGVCKIVGTLSVGEMVKGAAFILGFTYLLKLMVNILKISSEQQIAKVSANILAMSTAILIMAAAAVVLGMVDLADLAKGVAAVSILGLVVSVMANSLKGAQNAKGAIVAMAVVVAVLAAAIVALSMIEDVGSLAASVAAMVVLMGALSLVFRSLKGLTVSGTGSASLIAIAGIIAILGGVIYLLQDVDPLSAISSAVSLSVLLATMAGVLKILDTVKMDATKALVTVVAMAALGLVLRELVWVLEAMSGVDDAVKNVGALTLLFIAASAMLAAAAGIGAVLTGSGGTVLIAVAAGLGALAVAFLAIRGAVALFKGIAEDLSDAMSALAEASEVAVDIDPSAFDNAVKLLDVIGAISGTAVTTAIADFFVLGGTAMDKFKRDGVAFFGAMEEICKEAGKSTIDEAACDKLSKLLDYANQLVDLQQRLPNPDSLISWFASMTTGNIGVFGINASAFIRALSSAMEYVGGVQYDNQKLDYIVDFANKLMDLQARLPRADDLISWFADLSTANIGSFGKNAATFISALSTAMEAEYGNQYDNQNLDYIIAFGGKLIELQEKLPRADSLISWFADLTSANISTFGINASAFISAISGAMSSDSVGKAQYDTQNLDYVIAFAGKLVELQERLPQADNLIEWFADLTSANIATFGGNCAAFIGALSSAMAADEVYKAQYNSQNLDEIIAFAEKLQDMQEKLPATKNLIEWFVNLSIGNIGTFGTNCAAFITAMNTAMSSDDVYKAQYNSQNLDEIIAFAEKLQTMQERLPNTKNLIEWFANLSIGNIGTFGTNCAAFITAMNTAMSSEAVYNAQYDNQNLDAIIAYAEKLQTMQERLPTTNNLIEWFAQLSTGNIGSFGTNAAAFISALNTAMASEAVYNAQYDNQNLDAIIAYAEKLVDFQERLPNVEGFVDWWASLTTDNLSTFGTNAASFIGALSTAMEASYGVQVDSQILDSMITFSQKLCGLIEELPDESIFDGKMNLTKFSDYVTDFAEAMTGFGTEAANINSGSITTIMTAAEDVKAFMSSFADFDADGFDDFKPEDLGKRIKQYADKVADIDTGVVSNSITAASRLKTFISGLAGLDTSGIESFKLDSIGSAMKAYSSKVSGINYSQVSASVSAGNKLKNFITSLAGIDTSGVGSFNSALNGLGQANVNGVVEAFSTASAQMSTIGTGMMTSLSTGITSGGSSVTLAMNTVLKTVSNKVRSSTLFKSAGKTLATSLASGIRSGSSSVSSAGSSVASSGVSGVRSKRGAMSDAGRYLGEGLVAGINAMEQEVYWAGYDLGKAAVDGEKAGQNSASPSKETIKAGKWLGEGLIIGMECMGRSVYSAGENMGQSAVNATRSAMTTVLDALNSDMDAQPTIRPVVDLSDVQTGAAAVSGMFNGIQTVGVRTNLNAINASMNAKLQNGANDDIVSAINKLNDGLANSRGDTYNFGDFTYDDGSNVADAVGTLIRYARIGRRV